MTLKQIYAFFMFWKSMLKFSTTLFRTTIFIQMYRYEANTTLLLIWNNYFELICIQMPISMTRSRQGIIGKLSRKTAQRKTTL